MKALASFILRGSSQAILATVGFAVLSLMLPPLGILSGAALALVTLRQGGRQGAVVTLGSTVFVAVLAYFSLGNPAPALVFLAGLWLPLWGLAWVLRETRSLGLAVVAAAGLGVAGVLLTYLLLGDVSAWWLKVLNEVFAPVLQEGGPLSGETEKVSAALATISRVMTGIMASGMVLNSVTCLFLARAWQAQLFNPGGFREEFHQLRLNQGLAGVTLLLALLFALPLGVLSSVAGDMLLVLLGVYLLQGLAVAHGVVAARKLHLAWLVAVYVLAFFVLPQLMLLIALLGLLDTRLDFRRRLTGRT